MLTTDQKGAIAESAIVHAAIKAGIDVYRPVREGGRYDLIFDVGPQADSRPVQVGGSAHRRDRRPAVFSGHPYVQLRLSPTRNGQKRGVKWAERFEFEAKLSMDTLGP